MWFLHWFTHTQDRISEIEMNFLIPGHTKFSPDRHFGIAKKAFNQWSDETFLDAVKIIKDSSNSHNVIMERDFEDNGQNIKIYDWKAFLTPFYRKTSSHLKVFESHSFKLIRGNSKLEYRRYYNSEPMFTKITKENPDSFSEPMLIHAENATDSRIEELTKVEKFITPSKLSDFWKGMAWTKKTPIML